MARYDVTDVDKRTALEFALDALGELSEDDRLDGSERDAIGQVRQVGHEILEGER